MDNQSDWGVWDKRLEASRNERKPHQDIWETLRNHQAGRNFRKDMMAGDPAPVNLVNNYVRVILPHILPRGQKLRCEVSPKRPGPEYAAGAQELTDRTTAVIQEIRLLAEARSATRASFYSTGVMKVGFEARTGIRPLVIYNAVDPEAWTYRERGHGKKIAVVGFINQKKNLEGCFL